MFADNILLFDIDKTLLNTPVFLNSFLKTASQHLNCLEEQVIQIKDEYVASLAKNTDFDPGDFLQRIVEHCGGEIEHLQKLLFEPSIIESAVFDDVHTVLGKLKNQGTTLGIFSEGVESWQRRKFELMGIRDYFDPAYIFITQTKAIPEYLAQVPKDAIIIDDNLAVLREVSAKTQLKCVWLNRRDNTQDPQLQTIHSLHELAK